MGKGSKPTVGFWYHVAYHHGLTVGPIDAFLEFRGGDKIAWQGELTASGTININAPNLWGGEKDQGGIVGAADVMFGEPTQAANPYLVSVFGAQTAAWRGFTTIAFKGGRYGAMNPYPQQASYKFRQIKQGWDGGACWYPEKSEIPILAGEVSFTWTDFSTGNGFETDAPASFQMMGSAIANTTVNATNADYWRIPLPVTNIADVYFEFTLLTADRGDPFSMGIIGTSGLRIVDFCPRNEDVVDALQRPAVNVSSSWIPINASALDTGVLYSFEATLDNVNGVYAYSLKQGSTLLSTGTAPMQSTATPAYLTIMRSGNTGLSSVAKCSLARVTLSGGGAINPAHVLYYSRTASDMGREPAENINEASLQAAADKLYGEGFGICPKWDPSSETVEDFEKRICKLIGGSFNRSLEDGQWYLDLARGDYVLADLPILTDDDILDFKEQPSILDNAVNSVSVSYFDPEQKETIVTAPTRALGLVASFGTVHQTNDYPEIPTAGLAARVALRDLLTTATPTRAFDLVTTRNTYAWRPNQYFRLQSPKRGIADMVCIVGDKQSGTLKSGAIKLKAAQDIYSLPVASFVQVEPGVDTRPPQTPTAITAQRVIEAPYIEVAASLSRADLAVLPADVGYAMSVAADPSGDIDYTMMVAPDGVNYADAGRGDWCATATVNEADNYLGTHFTLSAGQYLDRVEVGMGALWDDEIVRVDAVDAVAATITLARGCADTVRATHAAGARLWFYQTGFGYDITEFTDGETVDIKLLGNTGSQQFAIGDAVANVVNFSSRAARPYPPGQCRINGVIAPTNIIGTITVTGVHRDRVQQADQLIDDEMATVGPETGTTYTVRYYLNGALLHTDSGLATASSSYLPSGGGVMHIEMESVRDGLTSYQMHVREFTTGAPLQDEAGALITTEDDQPILMG